MRWLALIITVLLPSGALAQSGICDDPQTQSAMNACSAEFLAEADKELNRVWPIVKKTMRQIDTFNDNEFEPSAEDNLLKAQRAWIDYRDGHCTAVGAQYAGGSIQPLIINYCMTDLTEKRTKELLELLEKM